MITLRLEQKLEQSIEKAAENLGLTKSELIRRSIQDYLNKLSRPDAWVIGEELFGNYASGDGNLSKDRKKILKNKIRSKRK